MNRFFVHCNLWFGRKVASRGGRPLFLSFLGRLWAVLGGDHGRNIYIKENSSEANYRITIWFSRKRKIKATISTNHYPGSEESLESYFHLFEYHVSPTIVPSLLSYVVFEQPALLSRAGWTSPGVLRASVRRYSARWRTDRIKRIYRLVEQGMDKRRTVGQYAFFTVDLWLGIGW